MTNFEQAVKHVTDMSPKLRESDAEVLADWAPDDTPMTIRFGELASAFARAVPEMTKVEQRKVLVAVDDLIKGATYGFDAEQAALTGFLEGLSHIARHDANARQALRLLPPNSAAFVNAYDPSLSTDNSPGL